MVDVDRRMSSLTHAHTAALRRLSTRASTLISSLPSSPAITPNGLLHSFLPLAASILSHLRTSGVPILPGLTPTEFALIEAEFNFHFPPDLRAVLSLGLPSAPGFPDWRSANRRNLLKASLDLPVAAVSLQITRNSFWSKSWGLRPSDPDRAVKIARAALRRSPVLIPLFDRCYLPSLPCLAGNPVFLISDSRVSFAGRDLDDFFERQSLFPTCCYPDVAPTPPVVNLDSFRKSVDSVSVSVSGNGKTPRWIEFWSDAAFTRRRRNSSSSSSSYSSSSSSSSSSELSTSPMQIEALGEIKAARAPRWVGNYLDLISSVLRDGGWEDAEVDEMVHVSAPSAAVFDGVEFTAAAVVDSQAAYDELLLNADRFSGEMRRAGWSSEEVSDALGFDSGRKKDKRKEVKIPPEIAQKIGLLAATVCCDGDRNGDGIQH